MHTAPPTQFLKLVIKSSADLNWRLKFHLQALTVCWMKQLQSQSEVTPPQKKQPSPLNTQYVYTQPGDNDWWLPRRPQPQPSPSQPPRLTDRDFLLR